MHIKTRRGNTFTLTEAGPRLRTGNPVFNPKKDTLGFEIDIKLRESRMNIGLDTGLMLIIIIQ